MTIPYTRLALDTVQGLAREIAEADASHPMAFDYIKAKAQEIVRSLEQAEPVPVVPAGPSLGFDPWDMLTRINQAHAVLVRARN